MTLIESLAVRSKCVAMHTANRQTGAASLRYSRACDAYVCGALLRPKRLKAPLRHGACGILWVHIASWRHLDKRAARDPGPRATQHAPDLRASRRYKMQRTCVMQARVTVAG
jgi:hypothetical protein